MREAVHQLQQTPAESTQQVVGYPALFVLVALGALVPVIPTGALVSSAAVVAFHHRSPSLGLVLVFGVAALGAFLGDVALYGLGQRGVRSRSGSRWLEALRGRATPERLEQARARLDEHGVLVLVVSRLVPAGRIPVMLACLLARLPLRRFARGDAPACLAWAATYGLIGIVGGSLFSAPWKGVALAVGLTLLVSAAPTLWRRVRGGPEGQAGA
ncbi:VTT domain-containing protein [Streptomyces sp. NPDC002138]|uniref:DedA family protein n=1 Tax=Streptomyces sp. NPDC002138 TaxID=3154410 RepID=UPI0033308E36